MAGVPPLNAFQSKLMVIQAFPAIWTARMGIIMILFKYRKPSLNIYESILHIYMNLKPAELEYWTTKYQNQHNLNGSVFNPLYSTGTFSTK
jgi:energy-converting hydrogenase B subunit F